MQTKVTYQIEQNAFSFIWITRTFKTEEAARAFVAERASIGSPAILEVA